MAGTALSAKRVTRAAPAADRRRPKQIRLLSRGSRSSPEGNNLGFSIQAIQSEPAPINPTNQTHPATNMHPPQARILRNPTRRDLNRKAKEFYSRVLRSGQERSGRKFFQKRYGLIQ